MELERLSSEYTVRRLTEADIEAVYTLSAENPLFYEHCPPFVSRESIAADMKALPPKKGYEDKFYIGFFDGERLLAVTDLILRYPNAETAFIGFFMLDKGAQGRGVGSAIVTECFAALKAMDFEHIRLGYAKGNPQSRAFWRKNGFSETGVESVQEEYTIVIMQKDLL